MTDEELKLVSLIKQKVDTLNCSIEQFEKRLFKETEATRRKYMAETELERFLSLKWLRKLKTPQVRHPMWRELDFVIQFEKLLAAQDAVWSELASYLNLYVLNTAIEMTRLKADKQVLEPLNELALINASIHNFKT